MFSSSNCVFNIFLLRESLKYSIDAFASGFIGAGMWLIKTWFGPHRYVDMPLDQDVEDGEGEVSQELPDLSSQEHPQDSVRSIDPDPAPAHRHL